jgi:hypothetical protein
LDKGSAGVLGTPQDFQVSNPRKQKCRFFCISIDRDAYVQKNLHMNLTTRVACLALLAPLTMLLSHCQSAVSDYTPAPGSASRSELTPKERPGLGTTLGREIDQTITRASFYRKAINAPDAIATFHYNDEEGAKLMAEMVGKPVKRTGGFDLIPGKLRVTVLPYYSYHERSFDYYLAGGRAFVAGRPGEGYRIRLENLTQTQIEAVLSIDGLDILDGLPASVRKPGYVIPAKGIVDVNGMRSGGKMKSLIFSSVAKSRAATAFGESGARNVGVIGIAIYEEDVAARRRAHVEETYVREGAHAFGG